MHLYQILVGCKPAGRHTEQHDIFFGISDTLHGLIPQLYTFWPQAKSSMHLDAIRRVGFVDGFNVHVVARHEKVVHTQQLFFLNLGGYKPDEFEEFHYKMLVVASTKAEAIKAAKQTAFYKHTGFAGAPSHIDDQYGVDVDDVYNIEDLLSPQLKAEWQIVVTPRDMAMDKQDAVMLGYHTIKKIEQGVYGDL